MTPQRIQLRRTKGWRKPAGAIVVARPSRWGNPFTVKDCLENGFAVDAEQARRVCTTAFRSWVAYGRSSNWWFDRGAERHDVMVNRLFDLRGHDLACWCPLVDEQGQPVPCHADVLLEIANKGDG